MLSNFINIAQAAEQKWTPITLNVPIAGIDKVDSFGTYFQLWYSFAIGAVGVLATVMIMWGGFKWLTSRGNSGVISESKQIIWSALTGLVLAFLSYTILYLINPRLTTIELPTLKTAQINVAGSGGTAVYGDDGTPAGPPRWTDVERNYCPDSNGVANFTTAPPRELPAAVNAYNDYFETYGAQYGVDPDILRAIAAQESAGNPDAVSPAGACGLMQFLPSTASSVAGRSISCDELRSNPELSIQLAAQHTAANLSGRDLQDLFAGYNGGYGSQPNSNGKLPALADSRGCAGAQAYECCKGPGGLAETQDYVWRTMGYYRGLK